MRMTHFQLLADNGQSATIAGPDGQPVTLPVLGTVGDNGAVTWNEPQQPVEALAPAPAPADLPDIVAAALLLDHHALTYSVEYRPHEARAFLAEADTNNDMPDQEGMVKLFDAIDALIPPTKTGYVHHRYRIGNEGSRVIYVEVVKAYLRQERPEFDYHGLRNDLYNLAHEAACSEYTQERNDGAMFEFRMWWD